MKTLRGIPTSRAYWELRAEQMMNRIFDPEPPIDVGAGGDAPALPAAGDPAGRHEEGNAGELATSGEPADQATRPAIHTIRTARRRRDTPVLLFAVLGGVCMVSAASSVLYLSHWNRMQEGLQQERNLLLMERLRDLGPAQTSPASAPASPAPATLPPVGSLPQAVGGAAAQLPPPPEEPWMEQLDQLPAGQAPVLSVPVSPQIAAPAPQAPAPTPAPVASAGPLPQLLGVVGAPGKAGSAIFQIGEHTSNVGVGESIGGSGWRLRSAEGDGVLIERAGQVRRLSIGGAF